MNEIDAALLRAKKRNNEPIKKEYGISLFSLGQHQADQDKHIDILRSDIRDFKAEVRTEFKEVKQDIKHLDEKFDRKFDQMFFVGLGIFASILIGIAVNFFK